MCVCVCGGGDYYGGAIGVVDLAGFGSWQKVISEFTDSPYLLERKDVT